jgi:3-methyl-2-oxobutanoate hydroxymethyltransferase
VREYANLKETMTEAISRFAEDVRTGAYPSDAESYGLPAEAAAELKLDDKSAGTEVEKP